MTRPRRSSASDEQLILDTRTGDTEAFAELWHRHSDSARRASWQFRGVADPDDLVAEAYTRILGAVRNGKGPTGAFRPYLFATIRNLVNRMSHAPVDDQLEDFDQFPADPSGADPAIVALDKTLTVRAFRSLPMRWQSVLWYTEVEGLTPAEVGPMLGLSANSTAALSYRAREGLRVAWLQAHVDDGATSAECRWMLSKMGAYAAGSLTPRDQDRANDHLKDCAHCIIVSEEINDIGSKLALVLLPLVLGGAAGSAYLAGLNSPVPATAAATTPPADNSVTITSRFSTSTVISAAAVVVAVSAVVAIAAVGAITSQSSPPLAAPPSAAPQHPVAPTPLPEKPDELVESPPPATEVPAPPPVWQPSPEPAPAPTPTPEPKPDPEPEPPAVVSPVVTTVLTDDQIQPPSLAGTAAPLARVDVTDQDDTIVGTVSADASGNWSIETLAITPATTGLSVVQTGADGITSPATLLGPFAFRPTITSPTTDLICGPVDRLNFTFTGWAGEALLYSHRLDGSPSPGVLLDSFDAEGNLTNSLGCTGDEPFETVISFYYAGAAPTTPPIEVRIQFFP